MKRRLIKLSLFALMFILAGAIINVTVAWACALEPSSLSGSRFRAPTNQQKTDWMRKRPTHFTQAAGAVSSRQAFGFEQVVLTGDLEGKLRASEDGTTVRITNMSSGQPML